MRTTADRIRHVIWFEVFGLLLVTPLGALAFAMPFHDIGIISAGSAIVAMGWNYLFNYGFDHVLRRVSGSTAKTMPIRVLHTLLFELGLLVTLMPLIAWYLGVSLWQALIMDIAFAGFYMVYAFIFNLAYDRVFPIPATHPADPAASRPHPL